MDVELQQNRGDDRHDDEGDLDPVEEEAEDEDHQHDDDHRADRTAWNVEEELVHQVVAAQAPKYQREHRGADKDDEHHGADFHGRAHDVVQNLAAIDP